MTDFLTTMRQEGMARTLALKRETPTLIITDGDVFRDDDGYWVPAIVLVTAQEVDERLGIVKEKSHDHSR